MGIQGTIDIASKRTWSVEQWVRLREQTAIRQEERARFIDAERNEYLGRLREFTDLDLVHERTDVGNAFGSVLRHYRKEVGYSQEELAAVAGMDRTFPSLLELGSRTPTLGTFLALACALKISPVQLLREFLDEMRMDIRAREQAAEDTALEMLRA